MGSELSRKYDLEKQPICNGGPGGIFQIYNATKIDRTASPVSIFLFEKKHIKNFKKQDKDLICDLLKQECQSLLRVRHPTVLQVLEPVLEDNDALAFVTEPIQVSLYSMLDSTSPTYSLLKEMSELEIQCGILELIEALTFLHNEARIVHCNLSPESVYITKNGKWKLGGLAFSGTYTFQPGQDADFNFSSQLLNCSRQLSQGIKIPTILGPNINYAAPELSKGFFQPKSDNFSLACLTYSVLNSKKQEYKMSDYRLLKVNMFSEQGHLQTVQQVQREISITFSCIPEGLKVPLAKMLSNSPAQRPTLSDLKNSPWFQDHKLRAIKFLENIAGRDQPQKVQFMKSLQQGLDKFEPRVLKGKVLPGMLMCLADPSLTSVTLPNIMIMMDKHGINNEQFNDQIWPFLQRMCTGKNMQAQTLYTLVAHTSSLLRFIRRDDMQTIVMPVFFKAFECGKPQLQEIAAKNSPDLFKTLEFSFVKSQILPRLLTAMQETQHNQVKVECFNCIKKIWESLDRQTLYDTIYPALEKVRTTDFTPSVNMDILELYELMSQKLGIEFTGRNILASLLPPIIDVNFTRQQFQVYQDKFFGMLKQVIEERNKVMSNQENVQALLSSIVPEEDILSNNQVKGEDFFDNFFQNLPAQDQEQLNYDQFDPNIFKNPNEQTKAKTTNFQQIEEKVDLFAFQESQQQNLNDLFSTPSAQTAQTQITFDNKVDLKPQQKAVQQSTFQVPTFQFEEPPPAKKIQTIIQPPQNQKVSVGVKQVPTNNSQQTIQKSSVTNDLADLFSDLAKPQVQPVQQQKVLPMKQQQTFPMQQQSAFPVQQQQPIFPTFNGQIDLFANPQTQGFQQVQQPIQQPIQQSFQQVINQPFQQNFQMPFQLPQQQLPQQQSQSQAAMKKNNPFGTSGGNEKKEDNIFGAFSANSGFNF